MKRYDLIRETAKHGAHMSECGEGEWVRYEEALAAVEAARAATRQARFVGHDAEGLAVYETPFGN